MQTILTGQFVIGLDGSQELLGLMPPSWQAYCCTQNEPACHARLTLKHCFPLCTCTPSEGWHVHRDGSVRRAVYVFKHRPLFALEYGDDVTEVTVLMDETTGFHIRLAVQFGVMLALSRQCLGIHGVSLLCGNEVVILSAPSGTGKTTLAGLLEEHCGAIVLNGDFALLSLTEQGLIFEPTPFCGSSGRCLNRRVRVNRIVFLAQAKENQWQSLRGREALVQLLSNSFLPYWDQPLQRPVEDLAMRVPGAVKTNRYAFAPVAEAATLFSQQLIREASLP